MNPPARLKTKTFLAPQKLPEHKVSVTWLLVAVPLALWLQCQCGVTTVSEAQIHRTTATTEKQKNLP